GDANPADGFWSMSTDPGNGSLFFVPMTLTKAGTGTVTFNGTNTFTDPLNIVQGVLKAGNSAALGGPANTLTVLGQRPNGVAPGVTTSNDGGTLGLPGGVSLPSTKTIFINGSGSGAAGAIDNTAGLNTING